MAGHHVKITQRQDPAIKNSIRFLLTALSRFCFPVLLVAAPALANPWPLLAYHVNSMLRPSQQNKIHQKQRFSVRCSYSRPRASATGELCQVSPTWPKEHLLAKMCKIIAKMLYKTDVWPMRCTLEITTTNWTCQSKTHAKNTYQKVEMIIIRCSA